MINLFTSFKAFIFPLNEFVCNNLRRKLSSDEHDDQKRFKNTLRSFSNVMHRDFDILYHYQGYARRDNVTIWWPLIMYHFSVHFSSLLSARFPSIDREIVERNSTWKRSEVFRSTRRKRRTNDDRWKVFLHGGLGEIFVGQTPWLQQRDDNGNTQFIFGGRKSS